MFNFFNSIKLNKKKEVRKIVIKYVLFIIINYHILVVCPRFAQVVALVIGHMAYDIVVIFAILMRDVLCCVLSGGVLVTVVV